MERRICMNKKDLSRFEVLTRVKNKHLTKSEAAKILEVSPRQLRRLLRRLASEGAKGLISKKLGVPSNNQVPSEQESLILDFLRRENHHDFGPTLAHEYLMEEGALKISVSSVRNVMIKHGLWHSKKIRELKIHPLRQRRPRIGELIQLDGSEHDD